MPPRPLKPTPAQLAAAHGRRTVPDIVGPGLSVLLVGINPGLYSGATGHHFARPGNRFWPALHLSGLTPRLLRPEEERELPQYGLGLTKLVHRATATAAELSEAELRRGGQRVRRLCREHRPGCVCFLGLGAYRTAFGAPRARIGPQDEPFEEALLWVLPNPSGLNANHQLPDFVRLFREVRASLGAADAGAGPERPPEKTSPRLRRGS
jgi:double-stranded uracil-DNA glycosylase